MTLTDRVALVTGGRRMGEMLARGLALKGADVALVYGRSADAANRAASAVRDLKRSAMTIEADLATVEGSAAAVARAIERFGRLDILVHMASTYRETPFDTLTIDDWTQAIDVDLRSAYVLARAAVPHLRAQGGGRIVTVADWTAASRRPRYRSFLPYYVAKAGVIALTEALALELAPDQILVNAVAPGPVVPPASMSAEERQAVERATPLGRWGGAEAVVSAVLALIESDFITGETVRVDGGRHLV